MSALSTGQRRACALPKPKVVSRTCTPRFRSRSPEALALGVMQVVKVDDTYHMYFADMVEGCGLDQWQGASQVKHATSKTPTGPYKEADVVRVPFAHK